MRAHWDREPIMEGRKSSKKRLGEYGEGEEEESKGIEVFPSPVGASEGTGEINSARLNKPFSRQSDTSSLAIIQQMTQIIPNLQAGSSLPAFKAPSMRAPDQFDRTKNLKIASLIKSWKLILHN
ncbi:hypothetical protein O181_043380 [Austropuccinia psidii MF-1]|uniref:Uncharacterized protein n=1 Tax=Austropuccinia psidii MF-1 TaxID=1389203 RepID=A0A9Q3HJ39_9BASI|nr:hypothetical protein [Austropuccinia psidii MF-1]